MIERFKEFIERDINKHKQKRLLEIFMILDKIQEKEYILSFNYDGKYLMVQIGLNDYIRVKIESEVIE